MSSIFLYPPIERGVMVVVLGLRTRRSTDFGPKSPACLQSRIPSLMVRRALFIARGSAVSPGRASNGRMDRSLRLAEWQESRSDH